MRRSEVPQEWIRHARAGRSAKWIAREVLGDESRAREVHVMLMGANAYAL